MLSYSGLTLLGLTLPKFLRARSSSNSGKAKSCILLWLDGGPSHLETFDLKPEAPSEVRGPFKTISTTVPGMEICEHLPRTATLAEHFSIIRSMTSPLGEHGLANEYLLTGYKPSPVLTYPTFGAVLAHQKPTTAALPPYITLQQSTYSLGAGFLGPKYEPFQVRDTIARGTPAVDDLSPFPGVTEERLRRRQEFLAEFDKAQAAFESKEAPKAGEFDQAFRLITSRDAKAAFNLDAETVDTRMRYGDRAFGKSCLLARRLIEADVPFVTAYDNGWDTHENLDLQLRAGFAGAQTGVGLIPRFDMAFSSLISDLANSGRLDETLVIAMGEFGRTPKLNTKGGRDHWPRVFSVVMAGGGVLGGQVIGSSDRVGESPKDEPITPVDLAYTIYTLLGIDPMRELLTNDGRPVAINQGGRLIKQIIA